MEMPNTNTIDVIAHKNPLKKYFDKKVSRAHKIGIKKRLKQTSRTFNKKAATIIKDIEKNIIKTGNLQSYEWDGKISGPLGIFFKIPDFSDPDYQKTKGFKNLKKACDFAGIKIKECKIQKTKIHTGKDAFTEKVISTGLKFKLS